METKNLLESIKKYNNKILSFRGLEDNLTQAQLIEAALLRKDMIDHIVKKMNEPNFGDVLEDMKKTTHSNYSKKERDFLTEWTSDNWERLQNYEKYLESEAN